MKTVWMKFAAILCILALTACAQLGGVTPQTFNQKLAVGYGTVTAVRDATYTTLQAKKISVADAQNLQTQADNARAGLDIAAGLSKTDLQSAENRLTVSLKILQGIQSYLLQRSNQ